MMFHWLSVTLYVGAIWMAATNITPLQSLSHHSSKSTEEPTIVYHGHRSSSRRLLQDTLNVTAECQAALQSGNPDALFANLTELINDNVAPAVLDFYNEPGLSGILFELIRGSLTQAVLEANCDFSMVRLISLTDRLDQLLTDGSQIAECFAVFQAFIVNDPFDRRRRLNVFDIAPEIQVAADFTDEWDDYVIGIFSAVRWDLTDAESAAVTRDIGAGSLEDIILSIAFSDALSAAIDAGCAAEPGPDILEVISETLATVRLGFVAASDIMDTTTMTPEEEGGDEDVSDSSSGENAAKSEVYVWDNIDMNEEDRNGEEEGVDVDNDNGLEEEVTLSIAESTMRNVWIGLVVFCGFNLCLCWCLMGKRKRVSVNYETAEEPPSISVHH